MALQVFSLYISTAEHESGDRRKRRPKILGAWKKNETKERRIKDFVKSPGCFLTVIL